MTKPVTNPTQLIEQGQGLLGDMIEEREIAEKRGAKLGLLFAPVAWRAPVVQVPNARDKRGVALFLCPLDCFVLRFEGC
jgi:hypothetical protein